MIPIANDTLLRALRREPCAHVPVWLMRQAGRYLPEYNVVRKSAGSFMALATSAALATEVTLQPLARFALDAAILFSDILTVPDAMGLGLSFAEGEGPRFARPLRDEDAIAALRVPDLARLRYVFDAVAEIKRALKGSVPLIGFAGSPFTLAAYMIEGGGSDDGFARVRRMAAARPDLLQRIVDVNAEAVAAYLCAQVEAGADVVMLFDTWGGLLPAAAWRRYSLATMQAVLAKLPAGVPSILFTKGGGSWLSDLAASGAACIGLDWTVDLARARATHGANVALQGNL
ncbi:MAG: uroporphyrinogen decarboxylase, partial [Casimicrobiaceae bacterium]